LRNALLAFSDQHPRRRESLARSAGGVMQGGPPHRNRLGIKSTRRPCQAGTCSCRADLHRGAPVRSGQRPVKPVALQRQQPNQRKPNSPRPQPVSSGVEPCCGRPQSRSPEQTRREPPQRLDPGSRSHLRGRAAASALDEKRKWWGGGGGGGGGGSVRGCWGMHE